VVVVEITAGVVVVVVTGVVVVPALVVVVEVVVDEVDPEPQSNPTEWMPTLQELLPLPDGS
jgi:hypothetical protein